MRLAAASIIALTLAACGQESQTSQLADSPVSRPTCTAQINSAMSVYSGYYEFSIEDFFSQGATLVFVQRQSGQIYFYDMICAHAAGWPSFTQCFENSNESAKFSVRYTGAADLSVVTESGRVIELGPMRCE